jgi:hypothetical protein
MRTSTPHLLAVALAAALLAPAAFADPPVSAKVNANATAAGAVKTTSNASDSVSARAATREAGRMAAPPSVQAVTGTIKDPPPGKGNWFADADIDGDGKLSVGEANANASVAARFGTIDANADGYVTTEEYRVFYTGTQSQGEVHAQAHSAVVTRDVWMKLDSNDDGKLSSGEVSANSTISGAFSAMDGNGDGFVTQAEYRAYAKSNL